MNKFNINHNGLVIGQCIGDNQQIVQSFGKNKIEATVVSSDHTVPSPLFSMTDTEMAQKLLDLLGKEDCCISDCTDEEYIECAPSISVEKLGRILRGLFN